MVEFVKKYAKNVYSQNGEDGIISEVFKRIGVQNGLACEFGAADGFWCSNTANLGWERVLLEASKGQFVTPENVNELVPVKLDLLSIDIDGNDYAVWKAYNGNAKVVVIEINSSLNPMQPHFSTSKGSSYITMLELGLSKGYFLLCHTGNMVFVEEKYRVLFPECTGDGLSNYEEYFNDKWYAYI